MAFSSRYTWDANWIFTDSLKEASGHGKTTGRQGAMMICLSTQMLIRLGSITRKRASEPLSIG